MLGTQAGSWSSNPLLLVEGAKPLAGSTTSPEIIVRDTAPSMDTSIDFRVDQSIFNQSSFNTTDLHATTAASTANERWNFNIQQRADYDTTRTSDTTSLGLEASAKRHLGLTVSPALSYNFTPLDRLSLEGSWNISKYEASTYSDYRVISTALGWSHKIDPLNTASLKVNAQRYKITKGSQLTQDTVGTSIGWKTQISPQLSAGVSAGIQKAKERRPGARNAGWELQYTFTGDITYLGEQDSLSLYAQRSQSPSGNGNNALQTTIAFKETHAVNQLFSLEFGTTWQLSDYPVPQTGDTRSLTTANVGGRYKITKNLGANLSWQYRYKTLVNTDTTAQDNVLLFSISYRPEPMVP